MPCSVLLLPARTARTLLWIVWSGAVLGVAFRLLWDAAPRWLYVLICTTLGWVAAFYLPQFWRGGGAAVMILVLLGGAFHTTGGVVYSLRLPDPSPRWFGFHEVFHAFTVAAFLTHFAGLCLVLRLHSVAHR